MMRTIIAICVLLLTGIAHTDDAIASPTPVKKLIEVAIIIDDIGYSRRQGLAALALPGDITYAVIPNSPNADFLAREAHKQNKELILHAPMSTVHNHPLGKLGLRENMSQEEFKNALNKSLEAIPDISGVNNHMGSLLTQKRLPMEWVMQTLSQRELYFIDSRTTSQSVAWKTAQRYNVPSLKRDVFLDHERNPEFIHKQFSQLITVAKRRGYAVAIAHPYPETIRYLKANLNTLSKQGIKLVPASLLVNTHSPNRQYISLEKWLKSHKKLYSALKKLPFVLASTPFIVFV